MQAPRHEQTKLSATDEAELVEMAAEDLFCLPVSTPSENPAADRCMLETHSFMAHRVRHGHKPLDENEKGRFLEILGGSTLWPSRGIWGWVKVIEQIGGPTRKQTQLSAFRMRDRRADAW